MTGKLKTRGNMMLATKLNEVLKVHKTHRDNESLCLTISLKAAKPPKAKL